jgi:hypothetical protein
MWGWFCHSSYLMTRVLEVWSWSWPSWAELSRPDVVEPSRCGVGHGLVFSLKLFDDKTFRSFGSFCSWWWELREFVLWASLLLPSSDLLHDWPQRLIYSWLLRRWARKESHPDIHSIDVHKHIHYFRHNQGSPCPGSCIHGSIRESRPPKLVLFVSSSARLKIGTQVFGEHHHMTVWSFFFMLLPDDLASSFDGGGDRHYNLTAWHRAGQLHRQF